LKILANSTDVPAVDGLVWATWPSMNQVYAAPVLGMGVVGAQRAGVNQWMNQSKLLPTDQVYSDTPNPASTSTNWWPVSSVTFQPGVSPVPIQTVTSLDPTVSWVDPTLNTDNSPITPGEVSGYLLGIRDVNAPGSAAGTYPKTSTVTGGSATSAPLSGLGFLAGMVRGGTYGIAAESEVGGAAVGAWSAEMVFIYNPPIPKPPVLVPMAPTNLVIT
jgi:hypothetical protein